MLIVVLSEDEYYNDPLIKVCTEIVKTFEAMNRVDSPIYVEILSIAPKEYGYSLVLLHTKGSYSIPEISKWVKDGELSDAIENYHNVHKSIYGIRPRIGNPEDWADINWVREQTKDCIAREDDYLQEQERMND